MLSSKEQWSSVFNYFNFDRAHDNFYLNLGFDTSAGKGGEQQLKCEQEMYDFDLMNIGGGPI